MPYYRINPLEEMSRLSKDVDNFFQKNFSGANSPRINIGEYSPRVDIIDDSKSLIFNVEVPGLPKEKVKVSVNSDNILTLKGDKEYKNKEEIKTCCKNEIQYGSFTRSFQLPELVDTDKIEAKYKNGVLTITIPKTEPEEPVVKDIEIS